MSQVAFPASGKIDIKDVKAILTTLKSGAVAALFADDVPVEIVTTPSQLQGIIKNAVPNIAVVSHALSAAIMNPYPASVKYCPAIFTGEEQLRVAWIGAPFRYQSIDHNGLFVCSGFVNCSSVVLAVVVSDNLHYYQIFEGKTHATSGGSVAKAPALLIAETPRVIYNGSLLKLCRVLYDSTIPQIDRQLSAWHYACRWIRPWITGIVPVKQITNHGANAGPGDRAWNEFNTAEISEISMSLLCLTMFSTAYSRKERFHEQIQKRIGAIMAAVGQPAPPKEKIAAYFTTINLDLNVHDSILNEAIGRSLAIRVGLVYDSEVLESELEPVDQLVNLQWLNLSSSILYKAARMIFEGFQSRSIRLAAPIFPRIRKLLEKQVMGPDTRKWNTQ